MRTPLLIAACFAAGFAGSAAFQLTLAPRPVVAEKANGEFNELTVRELTVISAKGKPRLQMFVDNEDAVSFALLDNNQKPRVMMNQDAEAQGVSILDGQGTPRFMSLYMETGETMLAMQHGPDQHAVRLVASKEATILQLLDAKGKEAALVPGVE